MSEQQSPELSAAREQHADEQPEKIDRRTWVTLGLSAVFFIGFATCANQFLFR